MVPGKRMKSSPCRPLMSFQLICFILCILFSRYRRHFTFFCLSINKLNGVLLNYTRQTNYLRMTYDHLTTQYHPCTVLEGPRLNDHLGAEK